MRTISVSAICDVLGGFSLIFGIGGMVDFSGLILANSLYKVFILVGPITYRNIRLFIDYIYNKYFLHTKIQII